MHYLELFVLGSVSAFSTCAGSCLPLLTVFIIGKKQDIRGGFLGAGLFSLAKLFGFSLLGLLSSLFGHGIIVMLGDFQWAFIILSSVFLVIVGLFMLFGYQQYYACFAKDIKHWWDFLIVGFVLTFIPCPPHLAVTAYVALQSHNWFHGMTMALSFAIGNVLVLLLVGGLSGGLFGIVYNYIDFKFIRSLCAVVIIFIGFRLLMLLFL